MALTPPDDNDNNEAEELLKRATEGIAEAVAVEGARQLATSHGEYFSLLVEQYRVPVDAAIMLTNNFAQAQYQTSALDSINKLNQEAARLMRQGDNPDGEL